MEYSEHSKRRTDDGKVVLETQRPSSFTSHTILEPAVNPQQLFEPAASEVEDCWWQWLWCSCLRALRREDTQPLLVMSSSEDDSSDDEMVEWDVRSMQSSTFSRTTQTTTRTWFGAGWRPCTATRVTHLFTCRTLT
ncbi:uncharacterized protein LOC134535576 [Bacillus rossius redtenbacheri]|uniref:uncharacterized protein LOC134535576 n=1 Tax=Bacillus rossius redtenbacheri TaxID=93214 RepID=UPI002FDEFD86